MNLLCSLYQARWQFHLLLQKTSCVKGLCTCDVCSCLYLNILYAFLFIYIAGPLTFLLSSFSFILKTPATSLLEVRLRKVTKFVWCCHVFVFSCLWYVKIARDWLWKQSCSFWETRKWPNWPRLWQHWYIAANATGLSFSHNLGFSGVFPDLHQLRWKHEETAFESDCPNYCDRIGISISFQF